MTPPGLKASGEVGKSRGPAPYISASPCLSPTLSRAHDLWRRTPLFSAGEEGEKGRIAGGCGGNPELDLASRPAGDTHGPCKDDSRHCLELRGKEAGHSFERHGVMPDVSHTAEALDLLRVPVPASCVHTSAPSSAPLDFFATVHSRHSDRTAPQTARVWTVESHREVKKVPDAPPP